MFTLNPLATHKKRVTNHAVLIMPGNTLNTLNLPWTWRKSCNSKTYITLLEYESISITMSKRAKTL